MTIDEAIRHCNNIAKREDEKADSANIEQYQYHCRECAKEHRQLAKWLRELKERRKKDVPDKNVGDMISRQAAIDTLIEKREWIEGYRDRWYRKIFFCAKCGIKIRTESWDEKRRFGEGTILKDNSMPSFCPNCGADLRGEQDE